MKRKNICIINGEIKGDYNDGYLAGAEKRANELEYRTTSFSMLCNGTIDTNREECIYSYINFDEYDGVIFNEHSFSAHKHVARSVEVLLKKYCRLPIVTLGQSEVSKDCFVIDGEADFETITEHLIVVHGCRRIYCLGGTQEDSNHRIEGFCKAVRKYGLDEEACIPFYGGHWVDCADKLASDIASGDVEMPEAVVCVTDIVAFALIKSLFRLGIRVPEDIRVCGYNAHPCAFNSLISVTTFPTNTRGCGAEAMNRLHELITGTFVPMKSMPRGALITGKSCGCGNQSPANLRFRLAEAEKEETQEMYFRNGKLEEAFMEASSVEALRDAIHEREYLIPEMKFLSVNLLNGEENILCQYMLGSIVTGGAAEVKPGKLFPDKSMIPGSVHNFHVVPIIYSGINYGYVVVGYAGPLVYNKHLKQFCHCLALWCRVNGSGRQIERSERPEEIRETEEELLRERIPEIKSVRRSEDAVVGKKNNLMHKVKLDRIFYFEAQEKHIYAVTKNGAYEVNQRLFEIEEKVSVHRFMRISKSIIVNLDKVIGVKVEEDRTLRAFFSKTQSVRVTRSYIKEFRERIGM